MSPPQVCRTGGPAIDKFTEEFRRVPCRGSLSSVMARADDSLQAALEDRLRFETLIADLSAEFVNLDTDLIDGAIQDAQRRIVEALDLDRSTLFQFSEDGELVFTHYWSRPGFPQPPLMPTPAALFPWLVNKILNGEMVC